jgi:hypothetical protein
MWSNLLWGLGTRGHALGDTGGGGKLAQRLTIMCVVVVAVG